MEKADNGIEDKGQNRSQDHRRNNDLDALEQRYRTQE
jgi:hypothetical protein